MSAHLRSNAVAYVALFVALAGSSYAAIQLPRGSVGSKQLKRSSVKTKKLADGAVQGPKLAAGAVDGSKLADGAVQGPKLAAGAVDGSKLADGAVQGPKLAAGAVDGSKLADGAVDSRALQDGSVAAVDLVPGAGLPDVLPSGRTLRGYWRIRISTDANGEFIGDSISFPIPLATAPVANMVQGVADPDCPGTASNPQAAAGNLCVYEAFGFHVTFSNIMTAGGTVGASRFGAGVEYTSSGGAGPSNVSGTWAVTAP